MRNTKTSKLFRKLVGSVEKLEERRLLAADFRTYDGSDNNLDNGDWGSTGAQLLRLTTVEYADGISEPAAGADGAGRPNARSLSNAIATQTSLIENDRSMTNFVFQWGQFVDHDLDLTEEAHPIENFSIDVPAGDPHMLPETSVPVFRSRHDPSTGTDIENPRQQINQITSFIDASNVYGSDEDRALALRVGTGGLMKTADGDLLPYNTLGLYNAAPPPLGASDYFAAGDIRANEQPGLTSMHTLFLREHNRLATEIAESDFASKDLGDTEVDEEIYQRARQIVGALVQSITYNEFLPALLGPNGLSSYTGYDSTVNPGIANVFSAALYRVGHTMLPEELMRLNNDGDLIPEGNIGLADSFFQPSIIATLGIEPFLKGLSVQKAQEIDPMISDSVRNMLFDPPAQFDLAAINIQRGRDNGLPDYNQARVDFGLEPAERFRDISSDPTIARNFARAYGRDINNVDVWLGGIAEDHVAGGSVGELIQTVLVDQFQRVRDGDRFYFENVLEGELLDEVRSTRLADIVHRNTELDSLQDEVFRSEDVFIYRAPSTEAVDIRVEVKKGRIRVVDTESGEVVAERRKAGVTQVVIFGSAEDDRISIARSFQKLNAPIEVHGGGGTDDRVILVGGRGQDIVFVGENQARFNSASVYFGNVESIEIQGRGSSDFILGYNSSVPLIVLGGNGSDFIMGSQFNDLIMGGRGRDTIFGLDGNDLLLGGRGRDVILGGRGDDILVGEQGRDYLFDLAGNNIIIQGSVPGEDDRSDPLWGDAFDQWFDDLARYGIS